MLFLISPTLSPFIITYGCNSGFVNWYFRRPHLGADYYDYYQ